MVGDAVGNMMGGRTSKEAEGAMIKEVFDKASQMSEDPAEQYAFASREFRRLGMNDRAMALEDRAGGLAEKRDTRNATVAAIESRTRALLAKEPNMNPEVAQSLAQDPAAWRKAMEDSKVKYSSDVEEISAELFGKPFNQLSPAQAGQVNQLRQQRGVKKATAGASRIVNNLPKTSGDIIGFRKELNAVVKPFRDAVNAADQAIVLADNAMKTGNFAAASSLARSLAKASGEEQLSREDVRAFGGDPSLVGSVSDAVSRLATGTVTNDTLRQLKSLAVILKNKNAGLERQELEKMQNLARASGNYSEAEINEVFDNRVRAPRREGGGGQTRTTKSGVKYTVED
jgi:hypothetical protein